MGSQIINLLNMEKRLDPDFPVQTINKINLYKINDVISSKMFLVFCDLVPASKNGNAENPLRKVETGQPILSHHPTYGTRNHVAENTIQEVEFEQVAAHNISYRNHVAENRNHVAENSNLRVELQPLPGHHFSYNIRNHVAENVVQGVEFEQVAAHNIICRNHVAENSISRVEPQPQPHHLSYDTRNHVAEKVVQGDESQILVSHFLAYVNRNHVAENIFPAECDVLHSNSTVSSRKMQTHNGLSMTSSTLLKKLDLLFFFNPISTS